jgi:hypothetical protein
MSSVFVIADGEQGAMVFDLKLEDFENLFNQLLDAFVGMNL